MPRNSIGLDIGTRAVGLAEVQMVSGNTVTTRFGRVLLPDGAVDHGEIVDPAAVGGAIQKLWKRLGLAGKAVHVGMANRRVVVRIIELPWMSEQDLGSAIRFQAQEHIPIPLDEAVMDYEVLDEVTNAEGDRTQRILVVAAERATITPLLAALQAANLEATSVELNAYALVRCFANGSERTEAIIDVGAGVTNVVVHQGGKIRFTRILPTFGGDEFTTAIAEGLDVPREEAELLKRQASASLRDRVAGPVTAGATRSTPARRTFPRPTIEGPTGGQVSPDQDDSSGMDVSMSTPERAAQVIHPLLDRFVTEVRGSLDFYAAQAGASSVERIVITGGGALTGGLTEQLNATLGVPVDQGDPFEKAPISGIAVTPEERAVAEPFVAVAIGLGLAGMGE